MATTPLQNAIERGMKPGGDLVEELRGLRDYPIRSRQDAKAICQALAQLPGTSKDSRRFRSPLHALAALFQEVESGEVEAFPILRAEGIPLLIRLFDQRRVDASDDDADDLLFVLKIMAMYRTKDGAIRIVQAARKPLKPDAYMWSVVLSMLAKDHPHRDFVFDSLRDPLPPGFIAVSLLDSANEASIAGERFKHPFDSPAGKRRLQEWLEAGNPSEFSYAHSATAALPFISNPERDQLFGLAMDHPDAGVQMEAAWASAKLGSTSALRMLARYCLECNRSAVAQRYLTELGREVLIPQPAREPDFQAKAEFANWLAHPNELGRPPDELEIVDKRTLRWPPERKAMPFWLIRYRLRDQTGLEEDDIDCGLVGSVTFCLFSYKLHQRPPEDAYAIHCYWEMKSKKLIDENDADDPKEYAPLIDQWRGGRLEKVILLKVAELSPQLKYPSRLVALASATLAGAEGWVVFDGPRSTWYPKSDMPQEVSEGVVLNVHVGRQLLGFTGQPERRKYLAVPRSMRSPGQIVQAYEKLEVEARKGPEHRRKELLAGSGSPLGEHFARYVEARASTSGASKADVTIRTYEQLLDAVKANAALLGKKAYDNFHPLGVNFEAYVDALIEKDRRSDVIGVIELFAPHWQHNLGYGTLGKAAFKASDDKTAERYFVKLRASYDDWYRGEEMSLLAECWHRQGRADEADKLLIECLKRLAADSKKATGSDRKLDEDWFQRHRTTYLRLFPQLGATRLAENGIPESTF
jgi:hypothetical protein